MISRFRSNRKMISRLVVFSLLVGTADIVHAAPSNSEDEATSRSPKPDSYVSSLGGTSSAEPSFKELRPDSVPFQQRRAFRVHISKAEKYRRDTNYALAIDHFQAAYQIYRDPKLLYLIGRAYHHDGKWSEALGYYEKYQREATEVDPSLKRSLDEYTRQLKLALLGAQTLQNADTTELPPTPRSQPVSSTDPVLAADAVPSRLILVSPTKPTADAATKPPFYKQGLFWGLLGGGVGAVVIAGVVGGVVANSGPKLPKDVPIYSIAATLFTY